MKVYVVLERDYDYVDVNVNVVYRDKRLALDYKERMEQQELKYDKTFRSSYEIIEKELI